MCLGSRHAEVAFVDEVVEVFAVDKLIFIVVGGLNSYMCSIYHSANVWESSNCKTKRSTNMSSRRKFDICVNSATRG